MTAQETREVCVHALTDGVGAVEAVRVVVGARVALDDALLAVRADGCHTHHVAGAQLDARRRRVQVVHSDPADAHGSRYLLTYGTRPKTRRLACISASGSRRGR